MPTPGQLSIAGPLEERPSRPSAAPLARPRPSPADLLLPYSPAASPARYDPAPAASAARYRDARTRRFAWWYDHLVDWMLCNPGASYKDIALAFGRSPATISLILSSDLFRARYAQRKAEHNARLTDALVRRTAAVAQRALDIVAERLEENPGKVATATLLDSADRLMSRLGYGQPPDRSQNVAVAVSVAPQPPPAQVPLEVLEAARGKMRLLEQQKSIEAEGPQGRVDTQRQVPVPWGGSGNE